MGGCGKFALGSPCGSGGDCLSGSCVDGVCCDGACGETCAYCAFPGNMGHCVAVPAGARDPRAGSEVPVASPTCDDQGPSSCGTNGRCDGNKACQRYAAGTVCQPAGCDPQSNSDTGPGVCRNGQCTVPRAQACAPFNGCHGEQCSTACSSNAD